MRIKDLNHVIGGRVELASKGDWETIASARSFSDLQGTKYWDWKVLTINACVDHKKAQVDTYSDCTYFWIEVEEGGAYED